MSLFWRFFMFLPSGIMVCASAFSSDAPPSPVTPKSPPAIKSTADKLDQRVTFDFMNADLDWVLDSLFVLTGNNIVTDPSLAQAGNMAVTMHVEDVSMKDVLTTMCKQLKLSWEIDHDLVRVFLSPERVSELGKENRLNATDELEMQKTAKLHVKFGQGDEIDLNGSAIAKFNGIIETISNRTDPARDGLIAYHVKISNLEDLKAALVEIAPRTVLHYYDKLELLVLSSEDQTHLHRALAILHALGIDKNNLIVVSAEAEAATRSTLTDQLNKMHVKPGQ